MDNAHWALGTAPDPAMCQMFFLHWSEGLAEYPSWVGSTLCLKWLVGDGALGAWSSLLCLWEWLRMILLGGSYRCSFRRCWRFGRHDKFSFADTSGCRPRLFRNNTIKWPMDMLEAFLGFWLQFCRNFGQPREHRRKAKLLPAVELDLETVDGFSLTEIEPDLERAVVFCLPILEPELTRFADFFLSTFEPVLARGLVNGAGWFVLRKPDLWSPWEVFLANDRVLVVPVHFAGSSTFLGSAANKIEILWSWKCRWTVNRFLWWLMKYLKCSDWTAV